MVVWVTFRLGGKLRRDQGLRNTSKFPIEWCAANMFSF